jgi:hypothetical protein
MSTGGGGEELVVVGPGVELPVGVTLAVDDASQAAIARMNSATTHTPRARAARAIQRRDDTDEIPSDGGGEAA